MPRMRSAALQPMAMVGAAVLPETCVGRTEASITRRPGAPSASASQSVETRLSIDRDGSRPGPARRAVQSSACWLSA